MWGKDVTSNNSYKSLPPSLPANLNPSPSCKSTPQQNPPPRDHEHEVLQHLWDVDEAFEISLKEITSDILSLEPLSLKTISTVFPLDVYFKTLACLNDQLSMVSLQSAQVVTQLKSAQGKLNQLHKCLTDAKDSWVMRIEHVNAKKLLQGSIPFSTGL